MISFIKNLFSTEQLDYPELMGRNALIIDVRTPNEYAQGHVKDSLNIPLSDIQNHILKIKQQKRPIVTCCRSGARSGSAASILENAGIEAYNGGSWQEVESGIKNA